MITAVTRSFASSQTVYQLWTHLSLPLSSKLIPQSCAEYITRAAHLELHWISPMDAHQQKVAANINIITEINDYGVIVVRNTNNIIRILCIIFFNCLL